MCWPWPRATLSPPQLALCAAPYWRGKHTDGKQSSATVAAMAIPMEPASVAWRSWPVGSGDDDQRQADHRRDDRLAGLGSVTLCDLRQAFPISGRPPARREGTSYG